MQYTILPNGNLRIEANKKWVAEMWDYRRQDGFTTNFDCDFVMYEIFEHLTCNSDLQWVRPEDIGALTSAPILGIRDENDQVIKAWGFMDYALRSPQQDLLDHGYCIFISGNED